MEIKFYSEVDENTLLLRWYVDLPEFIESGGTKEDCEMVAGADRWLDILSEGKGEITLKIEKIPFHHAEILEKYIWNDNDPNEGAIYVAFSYKEKEYVQ